MACGLPVITSTKSGAAELIVEHDAGLVCRSRDVNRRSPRRCARCSTRRRASGWARNARNAVLHLTPEAMTLALVLLYKELLEASVARQQGGAKRARRITKRDAMAAGRADARRDIERAAPGAPRRRRDGAAD